MIRMAVIGCGNMATELAQRSVDLRRAKIAAIYDPDPKALEKGCAKFAAEAETDLHKLAERADVDAFLIGSPGYYHHDNLTVVAPTGKPIYSEKPLCTTVERCDAMIETCRQFGSKLFVGQVLRLFPLFWKSHELLESGVVGAPRLISITRAGRGLNHSTGWRTSHKESGGNLLEVNSHEFDYMLFLLGEAESVYARGFNLNGWGDVEDAMSVVVNFKSGAVGMLHSSGSSPSGEYRVHIQAENGNILHGGFGGELRYRSFADEKPTVITGDDLSGYPNPYDRELTSFFDWIERDEPPLFTGETGRANVAIAEAAYRSIRSGQVEAV